MSDDDKSESKDAKDNASIVSDNDDDEENNNNKNNSSIAESKKEESRSNNPTSQPATNNGVKIFLRIKPTKKASGYFDVDEDNIIDYNVPKDVASGLINNSRTSYKFKFDSVLDMDASQEEVFKVVGAPCVRSTLEGFNSTVFAYGQTGSGKTFTITGGAERYVDRGLIPRALSMIFTEVKDNTDTQYKIYISYLEVYNERGYDLLHEDRGNITSMEQLPKVTMMEDEDGNCHLRGLSMHVVNTEEEALNLLFVGDTNRAVSETAMNLASSRSHCIFTISIESRKSSTAVILRSKLHMVDLAGSERAHKTGAKGQVLREAKFINGSLHFLEMVIVALHERKTKNRTHIPYRNSMITSVLRDSLGGNCKTTMVATVSAEGDQTDESLSTCRFAQRVARVTNDAQLNEELDPAVIIKRLKGEVATLKEEVAFLKGEAGEGDELTDSELSRLKLRVSDYVADKDPASSLAIGELSYTRIRACFKFLKEIAVEGGGSGSSNNNNSSELEEKIENLESCLLQRNNEIAILVNMVKDGKSVAPGALDAFTPITDSVADMNKTSGSTTLTSTTAKTEKQKKQVILEKLRQGLDPEILKDPKRAFEEFSKVYPSSEAISENKALLKQKYSAAKKTAAIVNEARKAIDVQKKLIEKIRKDCAISNLGEDEEKTAEESEEEAAAKIAIANEKQRYKESYTDLRSLKNEIENIQKLMERSRKKLQADFDAWYEAQGYGEAITQSLLSDAKINPVPAPEEKTSTITGSKDTDEDIAAFYKANELLKRRNSSRK